MDKKGRAGGAGAPRYFALIVEARLKNTFFAQSAYGPTGA